MPESPFPVESEERAEVPSSARDPKLDRMSSVAANIRRGRAAQARWAGIPLDARLHVIRRVRHSIATSARDLAATIPLSQPGRQHRNLADSLVAEVLPLAEACRFLEREAVSILRPNKLGRRGCPVWLTGVAARVERVPFGLVLILAPSNYPLFLPGVQALQALAAGNAVLWKPAPGGMQAAEALANFLVAAGLPEDVLQILHPSNESGAAAIESGVDKVFLTGHADTGRAVMHALAASLTPSVMELSGCDAVFILPGADLHRVAQSLAFGMRLNGSATCMAPRRIFATSRMITDLLEKLLPLVNRLETTPVDRKTRALLDFCLADAHQRGAVIVQDGRQTSGRESLGVTLVTHAEPSCAIMHTDIFAPVLSFCAVPDTQSAVEANRQCPYALTAAIFGAAGEAEALAERLEVGTVLINDLIVSTADPRVPFGGRGASGFGVTRGREGLLAMTAVKTILRQESKSLRSYASTGRQHEPFFTGVIEALHSRSMGTRIRGIFKVIAAARKLEK